MFYSKAWWMTSGADKKIKTTWKQQCQNFTQSIKTINNSNVLIVYLKHIVELREFNVLLPRLCLDASALVKVWFHAMQFCWFLQSKQHLMVFNTSNSFLSATSCQLLFTWIIERKERWYKGGGWEGGGGCPRYQRKISLKTMSDDEQKYQALFSLENLTFNLLKSCYSWLTIFCLTPLTKFDLQGT